MASITIQNLDDALKAKLRIRAARLGRSMEEEVQVILKNVLAQEDAPKNLGYSIHQRFADIGGFDLSPIEKEPIRDRDLILWFL
ncbi:VapB protein [Pseudanabaena sp. lw0831]|uniref:FitA-like ribbon-helix-helix domain-containing protein n=1 Tax=Pseudanabaena sp. lw0831 TaxID=1357935 RepID=UPI001914EF4C|nr:plasmid stabilization protein [Pseudanabaena sp. lw0831]GBO54824.1 VapB protein [Pseudanabaena sp. lw0831]